MTLPLFASTVPRGVGRGVALPERGRSPYLCRGGVAHSTVAGIRSPARPSPPWHRGGRVVTPLGVLLWWSRRQLGGGGLVNVDGDDFRLVDVHLLTVSEVRGVKRAVEQHADQVVVLDPDDLRPHEFMLHLRV